MAASFSPALSAQAEGPVFERHVSASAGGPSVEKILSSEASLAFVRNVSAASSYSSQRGSAPPAARERDRELSQVLEDQSALSRESHQTGASGASRGVNGMRGRRMPSGTWDAELVMTMTQQQFEMRRSRGAVVRGALNPEWSGRLTWDLCVLVLVVCDSVVLPFQLAEFHPSPVFDASWLWCTSLFFLCDLVMNFFTAYPAGKKEAHLREGELVSDKVLIALHYLRGWFWVDFLSTVPWTMITDTVSGAGSEGSRSSASNVTKLAKVVKLTRLLRLMRMLRLCKLSVIWGRLEVRIGSITFLNVITRGRIKVLGAWSAICHWGACIWWMFGKRDSLVTAFTMKDSTDAVHWTELPRKHTAYDDAGEWTWADKSVAEQYVFCFYWILGVMRTMPAEVTPVNLTERVFVLLFMFFAVGAFAVNIARITQAWFRFSARNDAFKEEMAYVRMHLRAAKCGDALQLRTQSYLQHLFEKRKIHAKELSLLNVLPEALKRKLGRAQVIHHLRKIPQLEDWDDSVLAMVCDATEVVDYLPGDKLTEKSRDAEAAFVLTRGGLQVFGADPPGRSRRLFSSSQVGTSGRPGRPRRSAADGSGRLTVVDDQCLFMSQATPSRHTVVALECSEVLRIDRQKFMSLIPERDRVACADSGDSWRLSSSLYSSLVGQSPMQDLQLDMVPSASAGSGQVEGDGQIAAATATNVSSG
ncbi:unnamed protein product [Prorocentrum cordatum]|uniref:Cyclic nucleotide-binding domain-containing protein n=1 Tax=Prorocentrum cordatum TaxID=2364126 RepID=A0ABN9V500_9DINO|nr:unnamed protein product [Polarella glacialis]